MKRILEFHEHVARGLVRRSFLAPDAANADSATWHVPHPDSSSERLAVTLVAGPNHDRLIGAECLSLAAGDIDESWLCPVLLTPELLALCIAAAEGEQVWRDGIGKWRRGEYRPRQESWLGRWLGSMRRPTVHCNTCRCPDPTAPAVSFRAR